MRHDEAVPAESSSRTRPLPADRFLNRELSWLDFNARVLELAEDETLPLLERVKFLAIFASNLDEFYMVRIAGLKRRQTTGLTVRSPDGLTIREQLELVTAAHPGPRPAARATCSSRTSRPRLEEAGIRIVHWEDLADDEGSRLREYFRDQVFPVLTPLAVDPAHPFPYISGLSLNLAVMVRDPDAGAAHFARVKVPNNVPRFVPVGPADGDGDVPPARGPHRRAPAAAVPGPGGRVATTCSGSPATPTSRWRRTATRTSCRRWSGSSPAAGSVPPSGSRSPRRWTRRSSRCCSPRWR